MKEFGEELGDFDGATVESAANAGKALAEMAATIPNEGGFLSKIVGENDMGAFSDNIVAFGSAMKEYATAIDGLDAAAVTESATAGKALAELAANIPNSGGWLGAIVGENDMDDFAEKIVPFGKAMKEYGDAVDGIKSTAIENSATSGKALVELANTVPNTGGLWGFLAGENDIDTFGTKLVSFGASMLAYSLAVKGIDADAITASATAGEALVKLAETVPNTGGLVSFFTGDNDLDTFGTQLVSFGGSIAEYSNKVKDVDPEIVQASVNAGEALSQLAEKLPEDKFFKNETTLDEFGSQLSEFGTYFAQYYQSVSGIETDKLSGVVQAVGDLVDIAKDMGDVDTKAMEKFGKALKELGNTGISEFIAAFEDSSDKITTAVTTMIDQFIEAANAKKSDISKTFVNLTDEALTSIDNKKASFKTAGGEVMSNFINGIESQERSTTSKFTSIMSDCLNAITNKYQSFYTSGQTLMTKFISGIQNKETSIKTAFTKIIDSVLSAIRDNNDDFNSAGETLMNELNGGIGSKEGTITSSFTSMLSSVVASIRATQTNFYNAGVYLATGFGNGISSQSGVVAQKARTMANTAYNAAMSALDAASPSKLFIKVGSYIPLGFAKGIESGDSEVENSISSMTKTAVDNTTNAIAQIMAAFDSDVDTQPTIRPVLDLSNIEMGTKKLSSMFSQNQAMTISARFSRDANAEIQNGVNTPTKSNVYQFTQNNYSPKALSRVEIYRQTNNQFSTFERMTET